MSGEAVEIEEGSIVRAILHPGSWAQYEAQVELEERFEVDDQPCWRARIVDGLGYVLVWESYIMAVQP